MKQNVIKIVVNALIGALTSIVTLYLGGQATDVIAVSGVTTGAIGQRAADAAIAVLA